MVDELIDGEAALALYANGASLLRQALAGVPDRGLDAQMPEGGWSIRQYVHHVTDGDQLWTGCIRLALGGAGEGFDLRWYWAKPQVEWAEVWNYAVREIEPSLALLEANRQHVVRWIWGLSDSLARSTSCTWTDGSKRVVSVGEVVHSQGNHVVGHCEDIRRIRAAHGL